MEKSRVALVSLIWVLFFSPQTISGAEVEMRVRRRDNVTIYSDCVRKTGYYIAWFRNSSHDSHHSEYTVNLMLGAHPRYKSVWNPSNQTYDLLVKNVSESDLGLYYCALHEKITRDEAGVIHTEDVYHYGNRTTRLSLLDSTVPCTDPLQTPSNPPLSDCSVCWKLLVSVCPVCVLLSSTCVYCIFHRKVKAQLKSDQGGTDKGQQTDKTTETSEEVEESREL